MFLCSLLCKREKDTSVGCAEHFMLQMKRDKPYNPIK